MLFTMYYVWVYCVCVAGNVMGSGILGDLVGLTGNVNNCVAVSWESVWMSFSSCKTLHVS